MKNIAVAIVAVLVAVSLYLLASASANTDLFSHSYPYLIAINGVFVVAMVATIVYQLIRLRHEYRIRRFGSRLKLRLSMMFALMALLPGLAVYAVSLQFVVRSIESWFDVRVDSALEGGLALGQNALDYLVDQLKSKAVSMALDIEGRDNISPAQINRLREWMGVGSVTLLGMNGQILVSAIDGDGAARLLPDTPPIQQLRQAYQNRGLSMVESGPDGRLLIHLLVPIERRKLADEPRLLQLIQPVPETFGKHAEAVQEAYRDYQQLTLGRADLKLIYTLTLTLAMLLALLTAIAAAFILARRLAAPLRILAEGTQAVAQGDFSPRRALPARDELGILTQSFSQMTRQ
ncbi:MAG: HAMP domain-containing protein, partial [Zoogloeaceae bacterium]|nr:HAMP domain-containing protein [Zoogloeaceae bacterium]